MRAAAGPLSTPYFRLRSGGGWGWEGPIASCDKLLQKQSELVSRARPPHPRVTPLPEVEGFPRGEFLRGLCCRRPALKRFWALAAHRVGKPGTLQSCTGRVARVLELYGDVGGANPHPPAPSPPRTC